MRQTTPVCVQTVGPEERQQGCEVGVIVRWCCSAHIGNEVTKWVWLDNTHFTDAFDVVWVAYPYLLLTHC